MGEDSGDAFQVWKGANTEVLIHPILYRALGMKERQVRHIAARVRLSYFSMQSMTFSQTSIGWWGKVGGAIANWRVLNLTRTDYGIANEQTMNLWRKFGSSENGAGALIEA